MIKKSIDTAPKDGTAILGYWEKGGVAMVYWHKGHSPKLGWSYSNSGSFVREAPDEWLEVPK